MKQKGNTTQVSFRSFSGLITVSKSLSEMAFLYRVAKAVASLSPPKNRT